MIVEATLENSRYGDFATEKNYYDKIFADSGVIIPRTYFKFIDGTLLDCDFRRISIKELDSIIESNQVIVKNTLSSSGHGVRKFSFCNGRFSDNEKSYNFKDLIRLFGDNFICQETIIQHSELARFHPKSLNTFRFFTYRSVVDNRVHATMATFKMGVKDSSLDNVSAGGIAVGINLDSGSLMKYAFDNIGVSFVEHPDSNVRFDGYIVPHFKTIESKVKELADVLSHARLIGWDVTVNDEGSVILIEPNIGIGAWAMQITSGTPLLGDFSDEVREYIQKNKNRNMK